MTAPELRDELLARGVELMADGERLRWRGPRAVMTPEVLARLQQIKPLLLDLIAAESEVEALVETVGQMQVDWQEHASQWSDSEYRRRRQALLEQLARLDVRLHQLGHCLEDHGWRVTASGRWQRSPGGFSAGRGRGEEGGVSIPSFNTATLQQFSESAALQEGGTP